MKLIMTETPEQIRLKATQTKANKKLREILDRITEKTPESLRDHEISFLRARATYLTIDEKKKFASILKTKEKPKNEYKQLQDKAKELGLKYVGVSKKNLIESLKNA